jgi:hypothetical protein
MIRRQHEAGDEQGQQDEQNLHRETFLSTGVAGTFVPEEGEETVNTTLRRDEA